MSEVKIGGSTFTLSPLPAMRTWTLQPRIMPAIAEAAVLIGSVAAGAGMLDPRADLGALELEALAPVIPRFFAALPPRELEAVTRELLAGSTCDGRPLFTSDGDPFDLLMRGRMLDVWVLMFHALRVNYPDFFARLGGSGGAAKAPPPSGA